MVSNVPAHTLIHGFQPVYALWLFAASLAWFALAVFVFQPGAEALRQRELVTMACLHAPSAPGHPGNLKFGHSREFGV